jgi:hypothetical protein
MLVHHCYSLSCHSPLSSHRSQILLAIQVIQTNSLIVCCRTWATSEAAIQSSEIAEIHSKKTGSLTTLLTLAGILRHTSTVLSVNKHLNQSTYPAAGASKLCYILGEASSLYGQGAPDLSNSFAAALWGVDFNLYCAATSITRIHMHQGDELEICLLAADTDGEHDTRD